MKNNDIKYFIYARKSTEGDSRQILSIPAQIEEASKLQEREGLQVVGTITDSHSAMKPFNRPEYTSMIKRIKKGEASGIIVWKIDRLARNHLEGGELVHLLLTGVIKSILTPNREYLSSDSSLLISLEASMASQYSIDLGQNVKRGLDKKLEMGQPPYIAPVGYLNIKQIEDGLNTVISDPKRFHIIRKAFDMILTRQYSIDEIATILNNDYHFRTRPTRKRVGKPISKSVLHHTFIDPFYTGYFNYRGSLHKGKYKPMITLEEYDTVQVILGRPQRSKPHKHEFAFTGFIKCGNCGCAITASKKLKQIKATGEYKTYTFYHCTKRKGSAVCPDKRYMTEREMYTLIADELEKIALIPIWKRWAFETIKEDYEDEVNKRKKLLSDTLDYERKLLSELDALIDLRISRELTEEQYNQKKAERQAQLIRVKEKSKKIQQEISCWIDQVEEKLSFKETASEKFKADNPKPQKNVCRDIGWNWTLQAKNLTFTKREWFYSVAEMKSHLEGEKERLEPIKTFEEFKKTPSYEVIRSVGRRLRDAIRTENSLQDDAP